MPARHYRRNTEKPNPIASVLKPLISVIVLSAFVVGITYLVRGVSDLNTQEVITYAKPILAKLNIDFDESKFEQVAGSMVSKIQNTDLSGGGSSVRVSPENENTDTGVATDTNSYTNTYETASDSGQTELNVEKVFSIGLLSDTHSNYANLNKAIKILKQKQIDTYFYLGDLTELGLIEDLQKGKEMLDSEDLSYITLSGDHDLWKTVGYTNYLEVFKKLDNTKTINEIKFVFFDNSPNYTVADARRISWLKDEIINADYLVFSQPLYETKLGMYMGKINGEEVSEVLNQRNEILKLVRESNVRAVISGDLHTSGQSQDPEKTSLMHIYVGALTDERNIQTPRFSIFNYYKDGSYDVNDVVLE